MSTITKTFRASFRTARRNGATEAEPGSAAPQDLPPVPCRAARLLALAHFIERQIEAGAFKSYGDAGRRIGMTAGRVTQVMNLLLLAPEIQESILVGEIRESERRLRQVVIQPDWSRQRRT